MIRALLIHISALVEALASLIYSLAVKPFIKRATVVEYTINYYLDISSVSLLDKLCKELIARLKIRIVRYSLLVLGRIVIASGIIRKRLAAIIYNNAKMRVNIVIILNIILMVRW